MTETKITSLSEGEHKIQVTLIGYDILNAVIDVTADKVLCIGLGIDGTLPGCGSSVGPGVVVSGWTVTVHMKEGTAVSDVCSWITSIGGWQSIQWTAHVLEAYYTYIGAAGHSVGFSPVTWDDVLGLYYYYINQAANDPSTGNAKTGCGFT